jgi:hypothetical protein
MIFLPFSLLCFHSAFRGDVPPTAGGPITSANISPNKLYRAGAKTVQNSMEFIFSREMHKKIKCREKHFENILYHRLPFYYSSWVTVKMRGRERSANRTRGGQLCSLHTVPGFQMRPSRDGLGATPK